MDEHGKLQKTVRRHRFRTNLNTPGLWELDHSVALLPRQFTCYVFEFHRGLFSVGEQALLRREVFLLYCLPLHLSFVEQ